MDQTPDRGGLGAFFVLACAITWACALPAALAWARHDTPDPSALSLVGLSAFGPLLAAVAVAIRRRRLADVFRPWRTRLRWIVLALCTPMLLQLVAKLIALALGWPASEWVSLPVQPEHIAALVVFTVGEEFGWRGFAHPRMVARYGPVVGPLLLGCVWALWHAMFLVSPKTGGFDAMSAMMMLSLPLYSIVYAWMLRRGGGSLAIALALHAGAHLDNLNRLPSHELGVRVMTLLVVAVTAGLAARSLSRSRPTHDRA